MQYSWNHSSKDCVNCLKVDSTVLLVCVKLLIGITPVSCDIIILLSAVAHYGLLMVHRAACVCSSQGVNSVAAVWTAAEHMLPISCVVLTQGSSRLISASLDRTAKVCTTADTT
jgi:hypothetical protein